MPVHFTTTPSPAVYRVGRPLSAAELDAIRQRIHADVSGPRELLDTVVAAVFTALLTDLGDTYAEHDTGTGFERGQYAIPITQWTAICLAVTDRAGAWKSTIWIEMDFAASMSSAYDAPSITTPDLTPPGRTADVRELEITHDAARPSPLAGSTSTRSAPPIAGSADPSSPRSPAGPSS